MSFVDRNKQFLTDLFDGEFPGHAVVILPPDLDWIAADFHRGCDSIEERAARIERDYEIRYRFHEEIGDDMVPFAGMMTGVWFFSGAFGCRVVDFEDSLPAPVPLVTTAAEADALTKPDIWSGDMGRHLELTLAVRKRLGPDVPIGLPDTQSALDVAAMVWEKGAFLAATIEAPDAVRRLIATCQDLIKDYLTERIRIGGELNPVTCPYLWAPARLGIGMSEDEVGVISSRMYQQLGLNHLIDLSETFGGLFLHCCADADHQYPNFKKLPNLRALNRVFQASGPEPALRAFDDRTVHMVAWKTVEEMCEYLDYDVPGVRFAFSYTAESKDDGKRALEILRKRCPRS